MMKTAVGAGFLGVAALLTLSGCYSPSVDVGMGKDGPIPLCPPGPEIPIASLNDTENAKCSLDGHTVVLPNGDKLKLMGDGQTQTCSGITKSCGPQYSSVDLGTYGFVVAVAEPNCQHVRYWGPRAAIARVLDGFGEGWACQNQGWH